MNLIRWNPTRTGYRELTTLQDEMNRLFDGAFTGPGALRGDLEGSFAPAVDIEEHADAFVVRMDLPGVAQKDVKVSLLGDTLTVRGGDATLAQQLKALDQKMLDVELMLLSRTDLHSDDKWYVEKYKLYMNLVWLLAEVGGSGGDVAGGVGYRPTKAALGVFQDRLKELEVGNAEFKKLLAEVEAFNKTHAGRLTAITDKMPGSPR